MKLNYKKIGDHIREVNIRDKELQANTLFGVNIDKYFMPSVANIIGTDMTAYKVVKQGQFACNRMHVGRDYRLPVALSKSEEDFIVSPAYDVFEIKDKGILLPEYLMMWFSRKEFDRNAWFYTDADVRGGLPWESFCEMQLPIPHHDKQREIVNEYNTIVNRIELNNQLIQKLEETARAIYKQWSVDFEFPDEEGKPYKSSGGEMEFNEELQKEIPKGWKNSTLGDILILNYGKALPNGGRLNGTVKVYSSAGQFGLCNKALANEPTVIVGRKGSIGTIFYEEEACYCIDTAYFIKGSECQYPLIFIYDLLRKLNLTSMDEDSAVPGLNRNTVYAIKVVVPKDSIVKEYSKLLGKINSMNMNLLFQNKKLIEFQEILLSKLATVGD